RTPDLGGSAHSRAGRHRRGRLPPRLELWEGRRPNRRPHSLARPRRPPNGLSAWLTPERSKLLVLRSSLLWICKRQIEPTNNNSRITTMFTLYTITFTHIIDLSELHSELERSLHETVELKFEIPAASLELTDDP